MTKYSNCLPVCLRRADECMELVCRYLPDSQLSCGPCCFFQIWRRLVSESRGSPQVSAQEDLGKRIPLAAGPCADHVDSLMNVIRHLAELSSMHVQDTTYTTNGETPKPYSPIPIYLRLYVYIYIYIYIYIYTIYTYIHIE